MSSLAEDARAAERAEWLEWRRTGLGGSDIAGILGLSKWESPWSIWANKVGILPDRDASEAMEFGQRAEMMLEAYFEDRTGLWVRGRQERRQHPTHEWMKCTIDGRAHEARSGSDDPTDAIGVVEYKTTADPPEAWADHVPT